MKVRKEVYDTYWYFAAERQNIFFRKLSGQNHPYTQDPILQKFKFCNSYRASDRVSQFLIKNIIYSPKNQKSSPQDTAFRILLFRLLNKIETWQALEEKLGEISLKNFNFKAYSKALEEIKETQPIYGNAFILCANKHFGYDKKHQNHLALLESIFLPPTSASTILNSKSLKQLFENFKNLPLIGNFMAYQIAIDLNYSEIFNFNENDFTIAGLGAIRGINKCFEYTNKKSNEYLIQYMVENQDKEFERQNIGFQNLFGRKLHAIDCQNLFCETDKYSRARFPELKSNRTQIKTRYSPAPSPINHFYPPKWQINQNIPHLLSPKQRALAP